MVPVPAVGLRFRHKRVLTNDGRSAVYVVTAIRRGAVFYRQDDELKARECVDVQDFGRVFGSEA